MTSLAGVVGENDTPLLLVAVSMVLNDGSNRQARAAAKALAASCVCASSCASVSARGRVCPNDSVERTGSIAKQISVRIFGRSRPAEIGGCV